MEKKNMKKALALMAVGILSCGLMATRSFAQQDKSKRPSPPAQAKCSLDRGKSITMDYSSPRAKGRKVYGGIVPYGEVWRAGANEATTFVTDTDVVIGGKTIPAGSYTIFAVPAEGKWTLVVSKKTGEWGVPYPGAEFDLVRVDMKASKLPGMVENYTIGFEKSAAGCTLNLDWENTRASVAIAKK